MIVTHYSKDAKEMTMSKEFIYGTISLFFFLWIVILSGSCASKQTQLPSPRSNAIPLEASDYSGEASWWACRFKMSWPPDTNPDGAVDLLLAHAVVEPVLRKHDKRIYWWRFHRRAIRDKIGHQFSFLFYAESRVASEIMEDIGQSDILKEAISEKIVEKTIFSDPDKLARPEVEAMSDPRWSPTLQRHWPAFIMGVSTLWLGLIDDQMAGMNTKNLNVTMLLEQYEHADTSITALWREEGQHAFLHHLSAIFGYEPLIIDEKEIRF